jgi:hypothetical protein
MFFVFIALERISLVPKRSFFNPIKILLKKIQILLKQLLIPFGEMYNDSTFFFVYVVINIFYLIKPILLLKHKAWKRQTESGNSKYSCW